LVLSGALDNFTIAHRAQYFLPSEKYDTYIDHLLRWGSQVQASHDNLQASLFGDVDNIIAEGPNPPPAQIWSLPIKLSKEKEVAGIFFSGHPLDDYRQEIKHLANATILDIDNMRERPLRIAAFVTGANHRLNQKGEGFGIFSIQDYASNMEVRLFKEQYLKFKQLMAEGNCVLIEGTYQKSFKVDVEEYVFRVNQVRLLSAAFEEFVKRLKIKIMLGDLSSQTIQALKIKATNL
jgi:DNA polymerase-3 subunit alpha